VTVLECELVCVLRSILIDMDESDTGFLCGFIDEIGGVNDYY